VEEPGILDGFKESPLFFVLVLFASGASITLALIGAILGAKGHKLALLFGLLAMLTGFSALGVGLVAQTVLRAGTNAAIATPGLSANDRARLMAHGYATAFQPLKLALFTATLPISVGALAMFLHGAKKGFRQRTGPHKGSRHF